MGRREREGQRSRAPTAVARLRRYRYLVFPIAAIFLRMNAAFNFARLAVSSSSRCRLASSAASRSRSVWTLDVEDDASTPSARAGVSLLPLYIFLPLPSLELATHIVRHHVPASNPTLVNRRVVVVAVVGVVVGRFPIEMRRRRDVLAAPVPRSTVSRTAPPYARARLARPWTIDRSSPRRLRARASTPRFSSRARPSGGGRALLFPTRLSPRPRSREPLSVGHRRRPRATSTRSPRSPARAPFARARARSTPWRAIGQTLLVHVFDRARRARERGRPGAPSVIHRVRASRHVLVPRRVHIASRVARCRLRSRVFLTVSLRRAPCATARAARAVSRRRRRRARSCASSVSPVSRSRAPTSPGTLDLVVIFADSTSIVDRRIARLARRGARLSLA